LHFQGHHNNQPIAIMHYEDLHISKITIFSLTILLHKWHIFTVMLNAIMLNAIMLRVAALFSGVMV
jgi:hypothetical protein